MTRKGLLALALLLVALLAGWWFGRPMVQPQPAPAAFWIPALQGRVEQVTAIEVRRPGQPLVRLERHAQGWVLPAKADYPADQASVARLLQGLAAARKRHAESFDQADEQALQVRLELAGNPPLPLLIGNPAQQGGQRVRRADEQQGWLIDQTIELPANELHWLDRRISAIAFATVRELVLEYSHERLSLFREQVAEPELRLRELPAGRQLAFASAASECARLFADLQFSEVAPLAQVGFKGKPALRFRLETFAGGSLAGELFVQANQAWLVLTHSQGLTAQELPGKAGWIYRLEPEQYQALAKKLTDLIVAKP
ncbi:MAG TPA: DUF4340 domain-containing protein [Pseudomonas sp.]|nr:DUF4340 domain-containing protein [Pseudomonas sp.]